LPEEPSRGERLQGGRLAEAHLLTCVGGVRWRRVRVARTSAGREAEAGGSGRCDADAMGMCTRW